MSGVPVKLATEGVDPVVPASGVGTTSGCVCPMSLSRAHPGDAVLVDGQPGEVRYVGMTKFASGIWCGVELAKPIGKHDGCVQGCRYFNCPPNCGIFVLLEKVTLCKSVEQSCDSERSPDLTEVNIDVCDLAGSESAYSSHATLSPRDCLDSSPRSVDSSSQTAPSSAGSGELWWDSDGDALDTVDIIGNIDVEEESLGILTPDGMEDQLRLMCSFEQRASLECGEEMERTLVPCRLGCDQCGACEGVVCEHDASSVLCVFEGGGEQVFDSAVAAAVSIHGSSLVTADVPCETGDTASVSVSLQRVATDHAETDGKMSEVYTVDLSSSTNAVKSDVIMQSSESVDKTQTLSFDVECHRSPGPISAPQDTCSLRQHCLPSSSISSAYLSTQSDDHSALVISPAALSGGVLPSSFTGEYLQTGPLYGDKAGVWSSGCDAQIDSDLCSDSAVPIESDHEHRLTDMEMESSGVYSDGDSRRSTDPISMIDENGDKLLSPVRETMEEELCSESTITPCRHSPFSIAVTGSVSSVSSDSITLTSQEVCRHDRDLPHALVLNRNPDSGAAQTDCSTTSTAVPVNNCSSVSAPAIHSDDSGSKSCDGNVSVLSTPERRKSNSTVQTKRSKKQSASDCTAAKRSRDNVPSPKMRAETRAPIKLNHPLPKRNVQSRIFGMVKESDVASKFLQQQSQSKSRGRQLGKQNQSTDSFNRQQQQDVFDSRSRRKDRSKNSIELDTSHVNVRSRRKLSSNVSSCPSTGSPRFNRLRLDSGSVSPALSEFGRGSSASSGSSCSSVSVSRSKPSMNPRGSVSLSKPPLTTKLKTNTSSCLVTVRSLIPTALHRPASSNQTATTAVRNKSVVGVTTGCRNPDARRKPTFSKPAQPVRTGASQKELEPRRKGSLNNNVQERNDKGKTCHSPKSTSTKVTSQRQPTKLANTERGQGETVITVDSPLHHKQLLHLHQRKCKRLESKLSTAREDVRKATQGFDAAMVLLNHICNKMKFFGVFDDMVAAKRRVSSLQSTLEDRESLCVRLKQQLTETDLNHQQKAHDLELRLQQADERYQHLQAEVHKQQLQSEERYQQLQTDAQNQLLETGVRSLKSSTEVKHQQLQTDARCQQLHSEVQNQQLQTELRGEDEGEQLDSLQGSHSSDSLRQEVHSLQHVLQLKCDELCALRRDCLELADLRTAHARLREQTQLQQQKVEELSARLERHVSTERNLTEENKRLRDSQERELNTNRRLSMQNEQLQYRLRTHQSESPGSGGSVFRSPSFKLSQSSHGLSRSYSESPRHCSSDCESYNAVCSVVEKGDSISWTLQLDDSMISPPSSGRQSKPDSID